MESTLLRLTRHGTDEGRKKKAQSHDSNQLIGHHNCVIKRHKAIPTAHSDAVVIARSEGTLWSKWHKHTRWLG
jgi:hypothetical protein